jgi:hypothetical protein
MLIDRTKRRHRLAVLWAMSASIIATLMSLPAEVPLLIYNASGSTPLGFYYLEQWMFEAIKGMLLDMLAAVARKDYDDGRRRQAQGQAKAKAEGRYKGRPEDAERKARFWPRLAPSSQWDSSGKDRE